MLNKEMTHDELVEYITEQNRQASENRITQTQKQIPIVEQVKEDVHEFNKIPTTYRSVDELDPLSKKLLFFLEARSFELNGDTKVNDQKLCEFLNVSRSTVQRRLANLKELGFINTIKKNFRDISRLDVPTQTEFFSDRVIRCYRIIVQRRFRVLKNPGWKYDPRPKWNPNGIVEKETGQHVDRSWLLNAGEVIYNIGSAPIKPKWETLSDLQKMGISSPEVFEFWHRMNNLRFSNRPEGLFVLGYQKNREEDI